MIRAAAIAAIAALLVPEGVAAQVVCRPSMLGTIVCPAPPPKPRPILQADTQALDRVRRRPAPGDDAPVFVPARQIDRLGSTQLPAGSRPTAPCRADRLGNLRC
jgi:hypothetical protein